jgi:hypothetical protein
MFFVAPVLALRLRLPAYVVCVILYTPDDMAPNTCHMRHTAYRSFAAADNIFGIYRYKRTFLRPTRKHRLTGKIGRPGNIAERSESIPRPFRPSLCMPLSWFARQRDLQTLENRDIQRNSLKDGPSLEKCGPEPDQITSLRSPLPNNLLKYFHYWFCGHSVG